jgi:hypothetical protein
MAIYFPTQTVTEVNSQLLLTGGQTPVQTVEYRFTNTVSCANWATRNFFNEGTITPKSSSNKILVYAYMPFRMDAGQGTWSLMYFWVSNQTQNREFWSSGWDGTWRQVIGSYAKSYLDSPGTTATQTYRKNVGNYPTGTCYWNNAGQNNSDGYAYLRLTEISI